MGSSLPPKEANQFKVIVKSYETKQYKKGLKAADAILKKFPEHGETLSMKGLTLNCMDRKPEAYELVRRGLKNDLKSHVCWHVYGLLYRSDREYREAIKCYRNALRIDPDNIEILRDLSLLQAQMRDFSGFVDTRQQLLTLKPNHRMNWIGFAVAHHLNSNVSKAIDVLEAYEGTLEDDYPPDNERYEHGEMLLYKISLLEEGGLLERALEEMQKKEAKISLREKYIFEDDDKMYDKEMILRTCKQPIIGGMKSHCVGGDWIIYWVDKLAYKEQMASILLKLGRFDEAEKVYRVLLLMNPDNYRYLKDLQRCLSLYSEKGEYSADETERLAALYKSLREQYPFSSAVKRIPLDFLQGDQFREAADEYVRPKLTKGIPSLFSDLCPLYEHPGKANILEELFLQLEESIRNTGSFPGRYLLGPVAISVGQISVINNQELIMHYDRRGQHEAAVTKIDEAIAHTPTVIDLYSAKGRILNHAGNPVAASALADEARSMDLADRYLNSECVMAMLEADQVGVAEKTAVLFTKDGDHHNNLHDMQCMWYELASGESYFRQGDLGRALKNFLAVEKHYTDMTEDQFDFHSYCLRKMTLRAYVSMLKFQDQLHSHEYFHNAAAGAIRCYLKLYDSPPKSAIEESDDLSKLPPAQRKKLRQKQKKAEARAKKEAEEKIEQEAAASAAAKSGKRHHRPVDTDPHGEKLVQVEDPLAEATKYLQLLQSNSSKSLETHILSFEHSMRKQKVLLALKAVKHLMKLDENSPDSHRCLIKFFNKISNLPSPVTDSEKLVSNVVDAEKADISKMQGKSLVEVNNTFFEENKDSLMHRAAAAEMMYLLKADKKLEAIKLIEDSKNNIASGAEVLGRVKEWTLPDCVSVHKLLETDFNDPDAASRWKGRCAEYFPYSFYFGGPKSSTVVASQSAENAIENGVLNGQLHTVVHDISKLTVR